MVATAHDKLIKSVRQLTRRAMTNPTTNDLQESLNPIASLISKSEKARQKLSAATWQHTMLGNNLKALHIAFALMNGKASEVEGRAREELQEAVLACADMVSRTETSQAKFLPGTPQHTLQRNRLDALRIAEALTKLELDRRDARQIK